MLYNIKYWGNLLREKSDNHTTSVGLDEDRYLKNIQDSAWKFLLSPDYFSTDFCFICLKMIMTNTWITLIRFFLNLNFGNWKKLKPRLGFFKNKKIEIEKCFYCKNVIFYPFFVFLFFIFSKNRKFWCNWTGNNDPRSIFPSIIGMDKHTLIMIGMGKKDS